MLTDGEDEGIIEREIRTLRLRNVEVMTLGMGSRMESQEGVWWILASVCDRQTQS